MTRRRILVTAALPYANGPIHLGHLVEYIQTDIWVRFQKLRGHKVVFVCADDTHGTAIMKSARERRCSEEEFISEMHAAHLSDFSRFQIEFDNYGSTHSAENRGLCEEIWQALQRRELVERRPVNEWFDPVSGESLPDRFVRGTCPRCKAPQQYGDNCDKCGATYSAIDLIDPISTISGKPPREGSCDHFFIKIENLHSFLEDWTQSGKHLQDEVANYLRGHFLHEPLRDWDVSRPKPYFGFPIPGTNNAHYWYVWFDAPIGYMASTLQWCRAHGESFDDWWRSSNVEIHHFLGKDIQYFHCLFWPAMLHSAGFSLPTKVHIHGFLTVGGEKMSKSKGTFVKADTYLKYLDAVYLRYYYASKLGPRLDDIDMNLDEFIAKVNADLVNKIVNLASRAARFVEKTGLSRDYPDDGGLFEQGAAAGEAIAAAYESCDYSRAMRSIMELTDRANPFVESRAPWTLAKDATKAKDVQDVCSIALNLFRQIMIYLAPVTPELADRSARLLNSPIKHWSDAQHPLTGTPVAPFEHLLARVDKKKVDAMIEDSKEITSPTTTAALAVVDPFVAEPLAETISIEDFANVDLRVAEVLSAEDVPEARKLLKISLSLGGDHRRTVFAGIKEAYRPEDLVGRKVIVVANLAPRQMKFGVSEGMIVASGSGGKDVFLLNVDAGAAPGQRVH
jgi:methionyl-tRNA synthetase